jgi:phosphopentomutase
MGDLLASKAVFHDITHRSVPAGLGAPLITPEKAACNLLSVSAAHDFTLFEYFLTDRAGHKRDMASLGVALRELSAFVAGIVRMLPDSHLFLLTSDHGNCEDMTVPTHTLNPVPLVFHSNAGLPIPGDISSLTGVSPYIEKFFS